MTEQAHGDPDLVFLRALRRGQLVTGTATKIVPFSAFVRVEDRSDGFERLLHKSELAGIHVQAGDVLTVKIAQVDTMRRRIQLTRRP